MPEQPEKRYKPMVTQRRNSDMAAECYMSLFLCMYLPDWDIYAMRLKQRRTNTLISGVTHEPLLLFLSQRRQDVVGRCCDTCRRRGIFPGMAVAEARALLPRVKMVPFEPMESRRLLEKLARWAVRFSPVVSIAEPFPGNQPEPGADCLLLHIGGMEHLDGGVTGKTTTSDGAYMDAPQVWNYGNSTSPALNWDQVLVTDTYVNFGVLQDPADTQDDYLKTGNGQLRYSTVPGTPIASAPPYQNLPGSYRLNSSNQPEYYQSAAGATNTYESPIYNAYPVASVPDPAESIVLCDGGYATGWQTYADVATWANTTTANAAEEIGYSGNPNGGTNNISNINTTIHSGKFNVAYLDGHCATMNWVNTWAPAGQPVIVLASSSAKAWSDGGTAPVTTQWRQIFSWDFQDQ